MNHESNNRFIERKTSDDDSVFTMDSDSEFCATPLISNAKADTSPAAANSTFMQNQISIQRSPSTAISQASALSRKLSTKSNHSYEATGSSIAGILEQGENRRGRGRKVSTSSLVESNNGCSLAKSSSISTNGSAKSTKSIESAKSVRSVHAVGSYPLGSLRVHSPSPTRGGTETRGFLRSGDAFIVRDIPPGSLFGYDTRGLIIQPGDNFQGLRDIPPGAHLIWGGSSTASLRNGFWVMTAKKASDDLGEVHVKRWDKENEALDEEFSAAESMIQKESIAEIYDKLQPYTIMLANPITTPTESSGHVASEMISRDPNIWRQLTSCMKGAFLSKVTGREWNQWQVSSADDYRPTARDSSPPDLSLQQNRAEVLRFAFPKSTKTFSQGATGRERTEQAMDTSVHIVGVIHDHCTYEDSDEIIGEMQFCYITGMILGNLACMEHWAHIVKMLFKAYRLALDMPVFFRKVIEALHVQLIYDQEGDGSILDHDINLEEHLKLILTIFKSRLNELLMDKGADITLDQQAVGKSFEALEEWLWKWNWDLRGNYVRFGQMQLEDGEFINAELTDFMDEDERGEFAPAVVEMDEDGRERGHKKAKSRFRRRSKSAGITRWQF